MLTRWAASSTRHKKNAPVSHADAPLIFVPSELFASWRARILGQRHNSGIYPGKQGIVERVQFLPGRWLYFEGVSSITMLSSIIPNLFEFRSARGTVSARSHQAALHQAENLFPRRTKSFFYGVSTPSK